MTDSNYAQSIELPADQIFRNFTSAKWFALDIGETVSSDVYDLDLDE